MPAGPVADPPWDTGSWADDAWEAESWGDADAASVLDLCRTTDESLMPRRTVQSLMPRRTVEHYCEDE